MADDHRPYRMVARARQQARTRARILRAATDAFVRSRYDQVRVADVAAAAGVATQTVHLHFGSKDELYAAAAREIGAQALALRGRPSPGDVEAAVAGLMRQYEQHGDSNWRVVALEASVPQVAEMLEVARAGHRAWLSSVFAPLLPDDRDERERLLDALYVVTDVGTWKLLRRDLGCPREQTEQAVLRLVRGALAPVQQVRRATNPAGSPGR
jgi:AcrR family transcriptional regulator